MAEATLLRTILEIRYERGKVYLDRCGSTMDRLEEELGAPFRGSVPQMESAQLVSPAERLTFTYNHHHFIAQQDAHETAPVRLVTVAPRAWRIISESLEVSRTVTRCGMRIFFTIARPSSADVDTYIRTADLFSESPRWRPMFEGFDEPGKLSFAATMTDGRGRSLRASLSHAERVDDPAQHDPDEPRHVAVLDLDYVREGAGTRANLGPGALADFLKFAWRHAKATSQHFSLEEPQNDDA